MTRNSDNSDGSDADYSSEEEYQSQMRDSAVRIIDRNLNSPAEFDLPRQSITALTLHLFDILDPRNDIPMDRAFMTPITEVMRTPNIAAVHQMDRAVDALIVAHGGHGMFTYNGDDHAREYVVDAKDPRLMILYAILDRKMAFVRMLDAFILNNLDKFEDSAMLLHELMHSMHDQLIERMDNIEQVMMELPDDVQAWIQRSRQPIRPPRHKGPRRPSHHQLPRPSRSARTGGRGTRIRARITQKVRSRSRSRSRSGNRGF